GQAVASSYTRSSGGSAASKRGRHRIIGQYTGPGRRGARPLRLYRAGPALHSHLVADIEVLEPGVWRASLRTPTLPPATATNTLIVGTRRLAVIEPATPHADERAALDAM